MGKSIGDVVANDARFPETGYALNATRLVHVHPLLLPHICSLLLFFWPASMEPLGPHRPAMAFSVSAKHILLSEILSVTSVMRKNSRWALPTPSISSRDSALASSLGLRVSRSTHNSYASIHGSSEQELMTGFQDLKRLVKDIEGACIRRTPCY